MRYHKHHNRDERQHQGKSVTLADLARAIDRRRVPFSREGDEYVVRQADVRRIRSHDDSLSEIRPDRATLQETLDVGRSA
ncbi:MAG: hypothetical protein ACM3N4_09655 [Nitrososphaerota archaeon]